MDLKQDWNQNWLSGGFYINDHEIQNSGATQIAPSEYMDMSVLRNTLETTSHLTVNTTDDENIGYKIMSSKSTFHFSYIS